MPSSSSVLDASAVLAYLQVEPGAPRVAQEIAHVALIGAVNWAEVLSKLAERGLVPAQVEADLRARHILDAGLQVVPFDAAQARAAGELRPLTRAAGLSLGDRACLALALTRQAGVLTTERRWAGVSVGVAVEVIR